MNNNNNNNNDLSSEKIAKALKGAGLSVEQRIITATEAWSNNQLFFPNKDDFLFEWLCTALTKTKVKSPTECAAYQIAYWRLFHQLLAHYTDRAEKTRKQPPVIRVQLITAITTLLNHLNTIKNENDAKDIVLELYECVKLLLSPAFALSYRPTFEQMSTTVDQLMDTFTIVLEKQNSILVDSLLPLSNVLLSRYATQLVQSANQRKSFTTIIDKMFIKLLCIRRRTVDIANEKVLAQTISDEVTDILAKALFHPDVVLEYTSVLKKDQQPTIQQQQSIAKNKTSYVSKLFEELGQLLENKDNQERALDALDILPVLFDTFVQAFRKKRGNATSQDIDRQVEFGFFTECRILLDKLKPSASYVQTLSKLLQTLVQLNVYVARNDELSQQQFAILDEITETMISLLKDQNKRTYQGWIFELANIILKVDFSLIESRVSILWPYLLNPEKEAENHCLGLATAVLQTYAASRQMEAYVDDLINGLQGLAFEDVYVILEKPLFGRQFMDELSSIVNKHTPPAQALNIFERFVQGIQTSMEETETKPAFKKQKKHQHSSIPRHQSTARFIAIFLAQFIHAVRLSQHQRQAFEQPVKRLFASFIKPSLDQQENDHIESNVIPALQIHSSLMNTMSDIYWYTMERDVCEWMGNTLESVFLIHTATKTQGNRVAVILSANALLQHAYHAYVIGSVDGSPSTALVSRVNSVLDYVLRETTSADYETKWNGTLLHLNDSSVKIALWKLLADEWFDVICQFAAGERGKKLTSFVLLALLESPTSRSTTITDGLTLRSTSELLLRSANFYEASCFKEHAMNIISDSFASFFKSSIDRKLTSCYVDFQDFSSSANELANIIMKSSSTVGKNVTTDVIIKAMQYLNQLLLFPMEYYTKRERQQVVWMTFLTDVLIGVAVKADPETRTKAQLRSRTLLLRFFATSNNGNILEMNADLLGWFLTSTVLKDGPESDLSKAVLERTKQLDIQTLRSLISMVVSNATKAREVFDRTCKVRIEWAKKNQPNALDWVIDMVETIKESLHRHASKEDVINNISAQQLMSELSQFVINGLNDAKGHISTTLEDKAPLSAPPIDSSLLVLVSLLQEYAQFLGPQGDQVVDSAALSRVMVALASPCTTLLQRSLRSLSSTERSVTMKMITAFVSSLCKTLSRYQHVYVTERVFAVIWFIYSLVYESDEYCAQNLCQAFSSWVANLDNEQFTVVTQGFIEQSNRLISQATEKDRKVYLSLLSELLRGATDEQKSWLRRCLPALVTKISAMSRKAETVEFIQQALKFLTTISSQQSLRTSAYDISLILACLIQVSNPPHTEQIGQVSKETAHQLFHGICDVLQNLLLYHRQQLVDIMAPFIATLQTLLYCFRSPHLALVTKRRKPAEKEQTSLQKLALISTWAPLDTSAADRCARLFSTMAKKSATGNSGSSSNSGGNKRYTGLQQYRIISRHAPFVLIEYFTIQSNITMSISQSQIRTLLETGLYNLMDMTSESDRNMILASLDASGKLLFKNFYTSWKENHMYTGQ